MKRDENVEKVEAGAVMSPLWRKKITGQRGGKRQRKLSRTVTSNAQRCIVWLFSSTRRKVEGIKISSSVISSKRVAMKSYALFHDRSVVITADPGPATKEYLFVGSWATSPFTRHMYHHSIKTIAPRTHFVLPGESAEVSRWRLREYYWSVVLNHRQCG